MVPFMLLSYTWHIVLRCNTVRAVYKWEKFFPVVVPVWSGVNVAGVSLRDVKPDIGKKADSDKWQEEIHKGVVSAAYEIIKLKGYTSWAIGMSTGAIAATALRNSRAVCALSINVKGLHGINEDVYLSLPVVLGENGITHIVKQNLSDTEFQKSAAQLLEVQNGLKGL
ncbi:unnamed protein product [Gongylonema pulchrum]|uniref:Ldh_1_C domain-containing protein n=1 Tax=Gongylonema pulchrum TaxID=637853 RepID=A0A183CWZ2_9BILA|nr:unnamed protein product [Gongylonema pulchrum]